MIVLWLDSNTEHKGWSRRTPLIRLDRSAAELSGSQEDPPQYGRLTGGVKIAGKGRGLREKQCSHHQPLRLHFSLLLSVFLHVRQHPLQQKDRKKRPPDQVLQPQCAPLQTFRVEICGVKTLLYPLGAVACAEKLFAVFPATLERLTVGTGVVTDQVLLQMLHHPEHQRTAVPLSTQDTFNH